MSNVRAGRAGLIGVALVLVFGLLWLWMWPVQRSGSRTAEPPAGVAQDAARAPVELVPGGVPPEKVARTEGDGGELAPFEPARVPSAAFTGKRGSLRGHVEAAGEEPFPSRWQLVLRPSATLPAREHAEARTLAFEDARRDFEVADLPLGGYDVHAEAPGFNGQVLPILLEPGNEHPFVNLRLVPAGALEGRILDAQGLPAEGIAVTLIATPGGGEAREALTDAAGVYRFEKLPDGGYELLVGKLTAPLLPERRPVRFQAPSLTFPDIELPPLGEIRLRIVDSLERPLEGVQVRGSGTNGGIVEGTTDYDGRLTARHLPAGHFRLRLSHPNLGDAYARRIAVDVVAGQATDAPVRMGP